jgi:hypothetical protein
VPKLVDRERRRQEILEVTWRLMAERGADAAARATEATVGVARRAAERGAQVIFVRNQPVGVDEALMELASG